MFLLPKPTVTMGHSGTFTTAKTTEKKLNPWTNSSTKGTSITRNRNVSHGNGNNRRDSGLTMWKIIVIGLVVFALVLALVIWLFCRRRRGEHQTLEDALEAFEVYVVGFVKLLLLYN